MTEIHVATLAALEAKTCIVVRGADRPIAVFHEGGKVYAIDNRCPHMGFPLHRGSIRDGMVTCHWHHARFDACSGCTFDLFADDVEPFDVAVRDGEVYVQDHPRPRDRVAHARGRLREAMEQNIGLISGKSILTLRDAGLPLTQIVRQIAHFGLEHRDGWGPGMTVLAAVVNMFPHLSEETAFLGLFQAASRVADDCAGQPPRRPRQALETDAIDLATLERWLGYWTTVRHRNGLERTLLTAAARPDVQPGELATLFFGAASQRFYADTGHLFDFGNKAFELLETLGFEDAGKVLPSLMEMLARARGGEETDSWRHPADLVPLVQQAAAALEGHLKQQADGTADLAQLAELAETLLGDDPEASVAAIVDAAADGANGAQLGQALAYAAALRVARFGESNELGDWISALHSFSYCNAVAQTLRRDVAPHVARAALHGAISIYLTRFLNVPAAKAPLPSGATLDAGTFRAQFLAALDSQQNLEAAAQLLVDAHASGVDADAIGDVLALSVLREDFDFHTLQMVEAGLAQFRSWQDAPAQARMILVAVARYLAAHSPTQRSDYQTARIALRLHRGEDLTEGA